MIENLPIFISIVFALTTLLTVGIFLFAIKRGASNLAAKILIFLLPVWLSLQAVLSIFGFYLKTDSLPPRLPFFGILPALILIIGFLIFARKKVIASLPIKILTILHVVRIPVELVLLWLFQAGQIPQLMTFESGNFDILSGLTAPLVYWLAFRGGRINRLLLIVWNFFALGLLINIVGRAVLSFPYFFQQFAFDQPNFALFHFPFVWLPTVVVPIVLFCHLVSLQQLLANKSKPD